MLKFVIAYAAAATVLLVGDMLWLGLVAKSFYRDQIGYVLAPDPMIGVAVLFYALYLVGIVIFAVTPGLRDASWTSALLFGGLFGFFAYATYDLTNLATIKNWPWILAPVDLAWGTVLTAAASTAGYAAAAWLEAK